MSQQDVQTIRGGYEAFIARTFLVFSTGSMRRSSGSSRVADAHPPEHFEDLKPSPRRFSVPCLRTFRNFVLTPSSSSMPESMSWSSDASRADRTAAQHWMLPSCTCGECAMARRCGSSTTWRRPRGRLVGVEWRSHDCCSEDRGAINHLPQATSAGYGCI